MIQDEFGHDLWECVTLCGRVMACQDQYAGAIMKKDHEGMEQRKTELAELKSRIPALMDRLSIEDAAAAVRRYPWVLRG